MAEGASRRFQGATSGERVTQATILSTDCIQLRHDIGGDADTDKGIQLSQLKPQYVGYCATAAGTVDKVITIQNFQDFKLVNGMQVTVYFKNKNSADAPTFNVNNTGKKLAVLQNQKSTVSIGTGCWGAGAWLTLQYCKITTDTDSTVERWVIIGHDIAEESIGSTSGYTIYANGKVTQYQVFSVSTKFTSTSNGFYYNNTQFSVAMTKKATTLTKQWLEVLSVGSGVGAIWDSVNYNDQLCWLYLESQITTAVTVKVCRCLEGYK